MGFWMLLEGRGTNQRTIARQAMTSRSFTTWHASELTCLRQDLQWSNSPVDNVKTLRSFLNTTWIQYEDSLPRVCHLYFEISDLVKVRRERGKAVGQLTRKSGSFWVFYSWNCTWSKFLANLIHNWALDGAMFVRKFYSQSTLA